MARMIADRQRDLGENAYDIERARRAVAELEDERAQILEELAELSVQLKQLNEGKR